MQNNKISYEIIINNKNKYTNQDVNVIINFNNEINEVPGFILSNNRKTLFKIVKENGKNTFIVVDNFGNKETVSFLIDNIDKQIPEILGIENGKTYNKSVELNYKDNIGIQKIQVFKILDNAEILIENNPYKIKNNGTYKIVVTDLAGNINEKIIKIAKPYIIE